MLIDWFTVAAQIINFLILIALLKKFLYRPLLAALDRREERIRSEIAAADQARAEAQEEVRRLARERQDFVESKDRLFAEARQEAETFRSQELAKIRAQLEARREEWQRAVEEEKERFMARLRLKIGETVFNVASKALHDLAGHDLEKRVLDFVLEQGGIPGAAEGEEVVVRCGFPLDQQVKDSFLTRLGRGHAEVVFEEDRKLGFGVALLAGDRKIEWNLERYLAVMEEDILTELKKGAGGVGYVR